MPRYPDFSERTRQVGHSVFEEFEAEFRQAGKNLIPLHLGDTWMQPVFDLPLDEEFKQEYPYYNRYCNTYGVSALKKTLIGKIEQDNHFSVEPDQIIVTGGAVNALYATVFSILNPGEELIVLTPCWPFFMGIVKIAGGQLKEIPLYPELYHSEIDIYQQLEAAITKKTVALYVNTPNNPSGKVLSKLQLNQIADIVKKHRLWLISDEAYESFVYDGKQHLSFGTIDSIRDQSIIVYTFSKMFMVAGFRLGYAVANKDLISNMNKILVHHIYSAPSIAQYMLIQPVKNRHQWLPELKRTYQQARDTAWNMLIPNIPKPEAGYYLFFDVRRYLGNREFIDFYRRLLKAGVALAPGKDFGRHYNGFVRLCFTSVPEDRLKIGIERFNRELTLFSDADG